MAFNIVHIIPPSHKSNKERAILLSAPLGCHGLLVLQEERKTNHLEQFLQQER